MGISDYKQTRLRSRLRFILGLGDVLGSSLALGSSNLVLCINTALNVVYRSKILTVPNVFMDEVCFLLLRLYK